MFVYTWPYLFAYQQLISVAQAGTLLSAVGLLIWISTPKVAAVMPSPLRIDSRAGYSLLYGEALLWQVFWPFRLLLGLALILVDTLTRAGISTVLIWDISELVFFVLCCFWAAAVWRASPFTGLRVWGFLARGGVCLTFLELGHRLVARVFFPRDYFSCADMIFNFTNCF